MRTVIITAGLFAALLAFYAPTLPKEPALLPGAIRPQEVAAHVGENIEVEGVVRVHENAQATFLDLGGDYPNQALAVVIWPSERDQFGNLPALDGKPIAVWGEVTRYRDQFEIVAHAKGQIRSL
jgi:hypothetical protein